jgi:hypothetical protein
MKKFIISILCVAVFFIGLGGLIQDAGARFKSDERALELIRQARTAIGGDTAINNVRSLSMAGNVTKTFNFDGTDRTGQGELEINLQFPNQFAKMMRLRRVGDANGEKSGEVRKEVNVVVLEKGAGDRVKFNQRIVPNGENGVIVMKKGDGEKIMSTDKTADGKLKRIVTDENVDIVRAGNFHQTEMFRTALALLLTAPPNADVTFIYAGEGDVDGNPCDIVDARNGDSTMKLFLDKSSHLPRMISFQGHKPLIIRVNKDEAKTETKVRTFERRLEKPEMVEFQIRFSDYRAVGGVLLPHRWSQTVGGSADETIDVTNYEINPANIAEKFQNTPPKVLIRTEGQVQ